MKRKFKSILSLAICVLIAFSVALTGCADKGDNSSSGGAKPSGSTGGGNSSGGTTAHVCESKCPVCGLCLDTECEEAACANKCGGTYAYATTFKISDISVAKTSLTYDTTEKVYRGFTKNNEGAVSYKIYAKTPAKVNLTAHVASSAQKEKFTDVITTTFNGEKLNRNSFIPAALDGSVAAVNLGCINLKEKENVITFVANNDAGHEFDSIQIAYPEETAKYVLKQAEQVPHTCKSVCETCGGCTNFSCINPGCAKKCKCESGTHKASIFSVLDSRTYASRSVNGEKDGIGVTWKKTTTVRYKIMADADRRVKFGVVISSSKNNQLFAKQFDMTVNGVKFEDETVMCPGSDAYDWNNYSLLIVGEIDLKAGANIVQFAQTPIKDVTGAHNFQSFVIFSEEGTFEQVEIHNMKLKIACEATCKNVGLTKDCYYCSMCKTYFEDEEGTIEVDPSVIIPINPDNHVNKATAEDGTVTCKDCKKVLTLVG